MGRSPVAGMVMGAAAVVLVGVSMASETEAPSAGYAALNYGLLALGAVGFIGSLIACLTRQR